MSGIANNEDTKFSVYDMDEPGDVAQTAALNGDALHPEHLLHTGTEEVFFLKSGCHKPPPFPFSNKHKTTRLNISIMTSADWQRKRCFNACV